MGRLNALNPSISTANGPEMSKIWITALETLVKALAGRVNYQDVKILVQKINDSDLSGSEKRDLVIDEARAMGIAIASALLNLLIEVAVNALRARQAER